MNILSIYLNYYPSTGGIQNVIRNISEGLIKKGHNTNVICITESQQSVEIINGVKVFRIHDILAKKLFGYSLKFNDFFQENKSLFFDADVIHIHGYASLFSWQTIRVLAKNGLSNKIVYNPHFEGIGFSPLTKILHRAYAIVSRQSFHYSKIIICVSEYEKNNIIKKFNIDCNKLQVIANGITYHVPDEKKFKKISSQKMHLIYFGRIKKKKGIQYVLKALKSLQLEKKYIFDFTIIGEGPYEDTLKRMVSSMELQNVFFRGRVNDAELKTVLMNSDVFFLLSESEAYGIVVAEALSHNIFTIITKTTALIEFCSEPGCYCIDYPPKTDDIVRTIKQLADCGGNIGPFNPQKIRNWELACSEYEEEYNKIIGDYQ